VLLELVLLRLLGRATLTLLAQDPAEQPLLERRPRDQADAVLLAGRDDLELDGAAQQVVVALLADQAEAVPALGPLVGLCEAPRREVARPDVEDLALLLEDVEGLPQLVPRGGPVDVVHLVEVDVVGLHPAQRRVALLADRQRDRPVSFGVVAHRAVQLGGQHRCPRGGRRPGRTSCRGSARSSPRPSSSRRRWRCRRS
jgi:hypothetical protein